MSEYISREAVLAHKWEVRVCDPNDPDPVSEVVSVSSILRIPAADVVEVVKCRECRYHYKTYSGWFCSHGVFVNDAVPPDDFYCGYGKRKDGGQEDV